MMTKGHDRNTALGAIAGRGIGDLWREYMGGGSSSSGGGGGNNFDAAAFAREQQATLDKKLASQKAEEDAFMGRFRSTVEGLEPLTDIRDRIIGQVAPGYEQLRGAAQTLGERVEAIPGEVQTRAKQIGMSAGRIQQRVGAKLADLAPQINTMTNRLGYLGNLINEEMQLSVEDRNTQTLLPLQQEAAFISDRLNREITGYTEVMKSNADLLSQKLANQGSLEVQELKNLAEIAKIEGDYYNSEIRNIGGRVKLIDLRTGEQMDLGAEGNGKKPSDIISDTEELLGTPTNNYGSYLDPANSGYGYSDPTIGHVYGTAWNK